MWYVCQMQQNRKNPLTSTATLPEIETEINFGYMLPQIVAEVEHSVWNGEQSASNETLDPDLEAFVLWPRNDK